MISVIIPTRNAGQAFRDTLEAIRAQDTREDVELFVIDSGSTDCTLELCREYGARVESIRPDEFNHGRTRNRAIREARGELLLLTVQDAVPYDGRWLPSLAEAVRSDPKVAGAYSRHIPRVEANQFIKERVLNGALGRPDRVVQSSELIPHKKQLLSHELYLHYAFNNVSSMIRRSVWSNFPLSWLNFAEDIDWSKRVIDGGYKIVYEPRSIVHHSHHRGMGEEFRRGYALQKAILNIIGGMKRSYPASVFIKDMKNLSKYSVSYLKHPYIPSTGGRVSTTFSAFGSCMGTYFGTMLANKADSLERYGWFRQLDTRLLREL